MFYYYALIITILELCLMPSPNIQDSEKFFYFPYSVFMPNSLEAFLSGHLLLFEIIELQLFHLKWLNQAWEKLQPYNPKWSTFCVRCCIDKPRVLVKYFKVFKTVSQIAIFWSAIILGGCTSWEIYILILVMAFINPWGRIKNIYLNFGDGFYKSLG